METAGFATEGVEVAVDVDMGFLPAAGSGVGGLEKSVGEVF